MSLSPQPVNHAIPSPATLANTPPSSLAALLADSYHELESLRRELAIVRKRAEKAERLSSSLQALSADSNPNQDSNPPFPDSATRILMDFEDRAVRAELARDEAEARKRILMDTWSQLDSYLAAISGAAADARAGYSRVVSEGGGHLVLAQIPTLPTRRVPSSYSHPHPVSTGTRRARTPSIDGYQQQPPTKRPRAEDRASQLQPYQGEYHADPYAPQHTFPPPPPPPHHQRTTHHGHPPTTTHLPQPQARMILPPPVNNHHSPSHPRRHRSRSSSSSASLSVDEMLLQATTGTGQRDENGLPPPPNPVVNGSSPVEYMGITRHRSTRRREKERTAHAHEHGENMYPQPQAMETYTSYRKIGEGSLPPNANGNGGETREFQTHIFAPPVTGAPTKKSKFSGQESGPVPPPNPAHSGAPFPSVNDQGQRICRQCGVAGRLKDGKCVEKWGPGPMGPGTVCDRCRKKMKRVERRGTMDTANPSSSSVPVTPHPPPNHRPSHSHSINRTETLPSHHLQYTTSYNINTHMRPPPTPPPPQAQSFKDDDILIPTSEVGRGSDPVGKSARSASRNGHIGGGKVSMVVDMSPSMRVSKRSPLGAGDREEEVDADADAEAELEAEAEVEAELEGPIGKRVGVDARMDVDGETDLLDAVDAAAEVNSAVGEGE